MEEKTVLEKCEEEINAILEKYQVTICADGPVVVLIDNDGYERYMK